MMRVCLVKQPRRNKNTSRWGFMLSWTFWKSLSEMKVIQLCPILCNSMDCHPTGSSVHGILQGDIRDSGSVPGSERSPGGGQGNPLQDSYLENPLDRGAWRATVHRNSKSQTQLKRLSTHACTLGKSLENPRKRQNTSKQVTNYIHSIYAIYFRKASC